MIPHRTPSVLPWLYPSLTWRMEPHEKILYLTFDDGPVTGPTEYALEQLSASSVPATFFCIGDNVRKYPAIFNKIIADGHSVGNHTVNHLSGWRHSAATYVSNIKEFDGIAANAGLERHTNLFRPPYGRITPRQIKALGGYQIVMWDVLSQDYDRGLSPENCLRRTIRACRPGSIVVFHDSYKAQSNMEYTLPRLIDHFGGDGYVFKALPTI